MFVGLTVQNFSQIGRVVSSHEWLQTHRQTDTQTHVRTHTRLRFLPPDYRNTFSLLKRLNVKKEWMTSSFTDNPLKYGSV